MESLNVKNINDEKIFNVIDPNGQGEVVNRIRPISISINQKAETMNDQTNSTINLAVYWNDTWKSILDLTFDESLRQEYGKLVEDLTKIQKDIDMKQYKDAETKTNDFLKYVANLSSKYTAIPEKAVVAKTKNDFIKITADKNSVKATISDKLLNFMLKKYAKVDTLDYTKANECFSTSKFNFLANNYDFYYHSPEIFQKQAYMTVVKDNKVVGSYKVNYDQFSKFASKFMLTPQKLGYSKDRLAGYMKTAEVVMQNIFFDSVDEAKEWQEMVDEKKKEQATVPEGEEETTEIKETETKTKTEIGEGKSESPAKEDGGLARPSEDFASDEIPESEPRQQDQQGGGQNLGASRRVNLLKKKAGVRQTQKINNTINDIKQYYNELNQKSKEELIKKVLESNKDFSKEFGNKGKNVLENKDEEYLKQILLRNKYKYDEGYDFAFENFGTDEQNINDKMLDLLNKGMITKEFYKGIQQGLRDASINDVLLRKEKNLNKKKAKVGWNAKPENELEEIAVKIGDEIMEEGGFVFGQIQDINEEIRLNPAIKEQKGKELAELEEKHKKVVEDIVRKYRKEFANETIAKLVDEHLEDNNFHTESSIVSEFVDNEILASKKVKLKKKANKEYVVTDEWQEKNSKGELVTRKMREELSAKELIDFAVERWDADYEDEEITDLDSAIKWLEENGFKVSKQSSKKVKLNKKAGVGAGYKLTISGLEVDPNSIEITNEYAKDENSFFIEFKAKLLPKEVDVQAEHSYWGVSDTLPIVEGEISGDWQGYNDEETKEDFYDELKNATFEISDIRQGGYIWHYETENFNLGGEMVNRGKGAVKEYIGGDGNIEIDWVFIKSIYIADAINDAHDSTFEDEEEIEEEIDIENNKKTNVEKQAENRKNYNVVIGFDGKEEESDFAQEDVISALQEALIYFGEKWHELPSSLDNIDKLDFVKIREIEKGETVKEYTKEDILKMKEDFPKYSCNKKALYGDVQEQDIVPAKTETKVYLQSEKVEDFVWLINSSGRIEILAPKALVMGATGSGDNSEGVNKLRDYIKKDLGKISVEEMQKTVSEYGIDNVKEMDKDELERYLVWLLAGDTADNLENRLADEEDLENIKAKNNPNVQKKAEEQIPDEHIYEIIYLGFGQWQYIPTPLKPYIKQVMDILVEKGLAKVHDFGRGKGKYDSDLSIKEYVEKVKNIPEIMSIINKIYQKFGKKSFRLKSLNKKADYNIVGPEQEFYANIDLPQNGIKIENYSIANDKGKVKISFAFNNTDFKFYMLNDSVDMQLSGNIVATIISNDFKFGNNDIEEEDLIIWLKTEIPYLEVHGIVEESPKGIQLKDVYCGALQNADFISAHLEDVIINDIKTDNTFEDIYYKQYKQIKAHKKINLKKQAIEGDVQEQDIVPAKTETKVYLQSEDKAEEQTVEEKIEMAENDNIVKGKIGVGDIVTVCIDKLEYPEESFKYTELIGQPLILMENDKEDINKVIVEQTEYPFQRMTVNKDDIIQYAELKGADVVVEDTDGDEMITTFEELPIVAKQCKIKSIHKAATKKKANLTKKAINSLEDVAGLIDTIVSDYDWYGYFDSTEVGELSLYDQFLADVQKDEKGTIEKVLKYIAEDDDGYTAPEVEQLKEYYNAKFGGK